MNKEPIIFITKPEKQLKEKDNLEIEINNYDNSHLYYKGFDLGTFKEIANLQQENKQLKEEKRKVRDYINKHCVNEKISKEVGYKCYTMADTNELEKIMKILGDKEK